MKLRDLRLPLEPKIVVLTGAGISRDSGLATFRDAGGIWSQVRIEDVATPEAFHRDPDRVQAFYNARRAQLKDPSVAPNPGHLALAQLEGLCGSGLLLVTQNIDDLHERAGSKNLRHIHGELLKRACTACGTKEQWEDDLLTSDSCLVCATMGSLRPDVVWFGEMPYFMDEIAQAVADCELFIAIGTSGTVYPAAGFVAEARNAGAHCIEVNPEPSGNPHFHEIYEGPASEALPRLVDDILRQRPYRN
ncbi:NAD-dependent deacylase [Lacibacterium aquatile]|uniref:NAD-dependent protein deacylase n=1 Tax=Lacibacterium aquatile TaxID=1168082 RepID=A0ABW5DKN7_9PROT